MALIRSIEMTDVVFEKYLNMSNEYVKMGLEIYGSSNYNSVANFLNFYCNTMFNNLNKNSQYGTGYNFNSLSNQQLLKLATSVNNLFFKSLKTEEKKEMSNDFSKIKYAEVYCKYMDDICESINKILGAYGRKFQIESDMINQLVKSVTTSYLSNLPFEDKKTLIDNGNYFEVYNVISSQIEQELQRLYSKKDEYSELASRFM